LHRVSTYGSHPVKGHISFFYTLDELLGDMFSAFMVSAVRHTFENFIEYEVHHQDPLVIDFRHRTFPLLSVPFPDAAIWLGRGSNHQRLLFPD
jgi:hypothetical protein